MIKILQKLLFLMLHLLFIGAVLISFYPLAKWYFDARPLWGIDFYYTATLVNLIKNNLTWPSSAWNYAWSAGWPLGLSYSTLHYYLNLPLTSFFDLIVSVKIYMLITLALYLVGIYALCFVLSRNMVLSAILSIAGAYSVGTYGALMWGGSLPNFATQTFFPWVLFFIILFLQKNQIKYLLIAGLLTGLSILGHPQVTIAYIFPTIVILFLFSFNNQKFFYRIKSLVKFIVISLLIAMPLLYPHIANIKGYFVQTGYQVATSTVAVESKTSQDIIAFHKAQPKRIYQDNNLTLFMLLAVSAIFFSLGFLLVRKITYLLSILPFLLVAGYFTGYIIIFSYGFSFYHGGWYRLFWSVPVWVGMLGSALWGKFQQIAQNKTGGLSWVIIPVLSLLIGSIGIFSVFNYAKDIKELIVKRSTASSAFPDMLSLKITAKERDELKTKLVPTWINPDNTQYRLYSADQTMNLWWNSLYKMPLARGYFDPPENHHLFWLDAALNQDINSDKDQLTGAFNYPPNIAFNNSLFLLDWYAVKYADAGRGSTNAYITLPPSFFKQQDLIKQEQVLDFNNEEKHTKSDQKLHYYEFNDEYVSPILIGSNAPILGIISTAKSYETIIRALADVNLGVKQLVPLKLGEEIDKLTGNDLQVIDGLVLYDYRYANRGKAYKLITDYVRKGGRVFLDTGTEIREANESNLPEIFPISKSIRKQLGKVWDLQISDPVWAEKINPVDFDPPMFDQEPWNFTYPSQHSDIRRGTSVLITNHGKPVMIHQQLGSGDVYWSGMNFPYHVIRFHNSEEIKLFKEIINRIISLNEKVASSNIDVKFINAQNRQVTTSNNKGIIFKEHAYPGWQANISSANYSQTVKIYKTGPAYPGFIYVDIPKNLRDQPTMVNFSYSGSSLSWTFYLLSVVLTIFIFDKVLINGAVINKGTYIIYNIIKKTISKWWEKEDELE